MKKIYKGGVVAVVLVIIAVVIVGAVMFGRSAVTDIAKNTAQIATDTAKDKGAELVENNKDKAVDAVKNVVDDVKNSAMTEGKHAVGEAMKDVGEKLIDDADANGSYEEYAPEKIVANGGAVLDFYAPWCPSCRALEKNILAHSSDIPAGVVILKVDYDTQKDLAKKYGVVQQHTLVQVDQDGTMINKWVGSPTLEHLLRNMK